MRYEGRKSKRQEGNEERLREKEPQLGGTIQSIADYIFFFFYIFLYVHFLVKAEDKKQRLTSSSLVEAPNTTF